MMVEGQQSFAHRTVLLEEAVQALLASHAGAHGCYVDGTFGRGGHSRLILRGLSEAGRLLAFDKDVAAIAEAAKIQDARFAIVHDSFAALDRALTERGIEQVAGVLMDLGISSPQIDEAVRGFSFRFDGPLDMRMDTTRGITAAEWLAQAEQDEIAGVIRDYGEERFAVPIAKAIVARRRKSAELGPLERTGELAALVAQAVKTREKGQNPATRTFQALRIFINQELADLEQGLASALERIETGGRLVVISFHSLEDRVVKRFMQRAARLESDDSQNASVRAQLRRLPLRENQLPAPRLKLLGKFKPSAAEITANPRSRSAIMRVAEKLASAPEVLGGRV